MNEEAVRAGPRKTGMIILGGGLPKHHIYNANMMRNGADFAVIINTAQEFDGSDSGAQPDEAVSWGKIRGSAKSIKVCFLALSLTRSYHHHAHSSKHIGTDLERLSILNMTFFAGLSYLSQF